MAEQQLKIPEKFLVGLITLIIVGILVAGGIYFWRQAQEVKKTGEKLRLTPTPTYFPSPTLTPTATRPTEGGKEIDEELPETGEDIGVCQDLCGDGQCQKIVCLAEGCPCPETADACPQDCQ